MIEAVVFDWAGTTVDYGCFAPLEVFIKVFDKRGIEVTPEETRIPMGMSKRDHIDTMLKMKRVSDLWEKKYGRLPEQSDVDEMYADFEPLLFRILENYCTPIPGVIELTERLRAMGVKLGSTTGYTAQMMEIVAPQARKQGYAPDCLVTPNETPAGRPYPYMIYRNAIELGVYPMTNIVKVGDTVSDIKEGVNAGAWSVGVIKGSSELGMSEQEVRDCQPNVLAERMAEVEKKFKEAGADYIIDSIGELDQLFPEINLRIARMRR